MQSIPVYRSGLVVAFARVDNQDYKRLLLYSWRLSSKEYAVRSESIGGVERKIGMHQVVAGWQRDSGLVVDHKDRDKLNNQRSNLRLVTNSVNLHNRGINSNNSSGHKGVYWDAERSKWNACCYVNRKKVRVGRYDDIEEAVIALQEFRQSMGLKGYRLGLED